MLSRIPERREAQLEAHRTWRDEQWAADQTRGFPTAWVKRLVDKRWRRHREVDATAANLELLASATSIQRAHHVGVPADANDDQLCQEAALLARDTPRRLDYLDRIAEVELADREPEQRDRLLMLGRYLEALHWLDLRGVADRLRTFARRSIPAALRRLACERWWRGVLRGIHARAVETTARAIGLVNKRAGCYVSNESLYRRRGQIARNNRALESVLAVNEHGQDATLAELAAKSPANRAIRRQELMTRIAGFELIAKECGHEAIFVTVTCPSRMHAWRTKPGRSDLVESNPTWDKVTGPDDAQRYLTTQWRRFRAAAERAGVELYGFRIAEPNHDGTPHWHALLFFPPTAAGAFVGGVHRPAVRVAVRLLRRYFLWNSGQLERGARQHRVTIEKIDWARGSAAGYVAKYVAKNIDGYRVEKDLYGNDTLTSSQRVDAWASTWRIRQFQQIGGAPVGVWRELRRLHPEQAAASTTVAFGLDAVNVTASADTDEDEAHDLEQGRVTAAHGWADYLQLQGGHRVKRAEQRLQVLKESTGELGRYGEVMAPRPVGVVTVENRVVTVDCGGIVGHLTTRRTVRAEVESERATWRTELMGVDADEVAQKARRQRVAERLRGLMAGGAAARPWSPVNNCTRPAPMFGPAVERHQKLGRFHRWNRAKEPPPDGLRHHQEN